MTRTATNGTDGPPALPAVTSGPREDYPLIRGLRDRRVHLEAASRELEAAGQDEIALAVMAKIEEYTPIEHETLALFASAIRAGVVID